MDWDNDGKLDLVAGDASGAVWFFRNIGTTTDPVLAEGVRILSAGKPILGVQATYEEGQDGRYHLVPNPTEVMGVYSKIHVGDWNGDGLNDLLIGQDGPGGQSLVVYINTGTRSEPRFGKPEVIALPGPRVSRPSPFLFDWDGDGLKDLVCGTESGPPMFYRNIGTRSAPVLAPGVPIPLQGDGFEKGYRNRCWITDWNGDGKPDLLIGNFYSGDERTNGGNIWLFLGR